MGRKKPKKTIPDIGGELCPRCKRKSVKETSIPQRSIKLHPEYNYNEEGDKRISVCKTVGCGWRSEAIYHAGEWVWEVHSYKHDKKLGTTRM